MAVLSPRTGVRRLPGLLGPRWPQRDRALALNISWVAASASKLVTLAWWADVTPGADVGVVGRPPATSTRRWTGWPAGQIEARLAAGPLAGVDDVHIKLPV